MSEALWFGSGKKHYDKDNTRYYNVNEYAWAIEIEKHWPEIKVEVGKLIHDKDKNFVSNSATYKGLNSGKGWSSLSALFWGLKISDIVAKKCPILYTELLKVPGIVSISFSRLEPYTNISEHHGETNAIIRCHFGIEVPASLPECGMQVAGEEKGWEEGKWVFFNDAQYHSAWNKNDKRRILLIIDVIRPEFISLENFICTRILTGHFMTIRENKSRTLKNMPKALKIVVFIVAFPVVYLFRYVYNTFH